MLLIILSQFPAPLFAKHLSNSFLLANKVKVLNNRADKKVKDFVHIAFREFVDKLVLVACFIPDKLNINASGLTNNQIISMLKDSGKCDNNCDDFSEFLNQCDVGRFSPNKPAESQMKDIYDKAEHLLSELDRSLK